jgi:hypothetical protein
MNPNVANREAAGGLLGRLGQVFHIHEREWEVCVSKVIAESGTIYMTMREASHLSRRSDSRITSAETGNQRARHTTSRERTRESRKTAK